MKSYGLFFIAFFNFHYSYSQITLGNLEDQLIKIDNDITFTGTGGILTLKNLSIETKGIIIFTDSTINLEGVTIKSDKIIRFSNAATVLNITDVVDISCQTFTFPSTLLTLKGVDKPDKRKLLTLRFDNEIEQSYNILADVKLSYSIINK